MLKSPTSVCPSVMELKCLIACLFETPNPHPGLIFFVLSLCRQKIKNKVSSWYHLEVSEKELLALLHQAQLRQIKKQLLCILTKNQHGLLTNADADWLTGIVDELAFGNISEEELGFTAQSLTVIIDCIRNGNCAKAVAN
ncbi:MAG: hypothetical protein PHO91_00375 [Patescibacteria group bacterium]|nr:hypothetical protein [Patescibacteria group bacterium]